MGSDAPTLREHMEREGLVTLRAAHRDFASLEEAGHIRRLHGRARAVEPTRPATATYFQIERRDGEAVLVPLHEVRVCRDAGADILPVGDSPGASASGAFSAHTPPETKYPAHPLRSGSEYTQGDTE